MSGLRYFSLRSYRDGNNSYTFPDGEPHLEVPQDVAAAVEIDADIRNPEDLMRLLMLNDVLRRKGAQHVTLNISYLMGQRMDRVMDTDRPFTLKVVADILKTGRFNMIKVFDPHSREALDQLGAVAIYPDELVYSALEEEGFNSVVVIPDKGAVPRVKKLIDRLGLHAVMTLQADKTRDISTGKITGMELESYNFTNSGQTAVIIDDLCDGGRTFVELAKLLREQGAERVVLVVTHGIFSKGLPLEGIDHIYTTPSYAPHRGVPGLTVIRELSVVPLDGMVE